jgi:hypothetical protein
MSWIKPFTLLALLASACSGGTPGDTLIAPGSGVDSGAAGPATLADAAMTAADGAEGGASDPDAESGPPPVVDVDQCPDAGTPAAWSDLYNCYFGPSGIAKCGSASGCHDIANDDGAQGSGFVCGHSSLECWQGMNMSVLPNGVPIVFGPDGGIPLADPTTATLWLALRKTSGEGLDNMPLLPATATFSSYDVARIATWIGRGAPND